MPFGFPAPSPTKHKKKSHKKDKKHDGGTADLNIDSGVSLMAADDSLSHEDIFDSDPLYKSSPINTPKKHLGLYLPWKNCEFCNVPVN